MSREREHTREKEIEMKQIERQKKNKILKNNQVNN